MKPQTFIFIGRSGAGKGTQAKLLRDYIQSHDSNTLPVFYVETGSRFREFIKSDSYTSSLARDKYEKAERFPDFLAIWNWTHLLIDNFTPGMHLVMDGMPRSRAEAEALRTAFDFYGITNPQVVYVDVPEEWAKDKLIKRNRSDDKGVVEIDKKLAWFKHDVLPAVEYFKADPFYNYIEVNGDQTIEQVHADILSLIKW